MLFGAIQKDVIVNSTAVLPVFPGIDTHILKYSQLAHLSVGLIVVGLRINIAGRQVNVLVQYFGMHVFVMVSEPDTVYSARDHCTIPLVCGANVVGIYIY